MTSILQRLKSGLQKPSEATHDGHMERAALVAYLLITYSYSMKGFTQHHVQNVI
jgi:hypothetical protein